MHPALSIIFFTVASGVGLGLIIVATVLHLLEQLTPTTALIASGFGLVLNTAGLCASTLHLANPKNAWRAFSRFRSSWLSKEAVFALLFYPPALVYIIITWQNTPSHYGFWIAGSLTVLLALATVFSTGMIYACLRTIPQWHTALVPLNFILLALASGSLLLTLLSVVEGSLSYAVLSLSMVLLALAGLGKLIYYYWIGQAHSPTINTATGFTRAGVKLLDIGHSSGTFNTKEFGFEISPARSRALRGLVIGMGFVLPLLIVWQMQVGVGVMGTVSVLVILALVLERWLFFAEARHTVNLYHGRQRC